LPSLKELILRNTSNDARWIADNNCPFGYVVDHDSARAYDRVFAYRHAWTENSAAADPRRASNVGSRPHKRQRGTPVTEYFVVQSNDTRTTKDIIFDDHAAGQIAAALQRYPVANANVAFNVDVRANRAVCSDMRGISNEYKVADLRPFTDLSIWRYDAKLPAYIEISLHGITLVEWRPLQRRRFAITANVRSCGYFPAIFRLENPASDGGKHTVFSLFLVYKKANLGRGRKSATLLRNG
jgi:hypothetical protein